MSSLGIPSSSILQNTAEVAALKKNLSKFNYTDFVDQALVN